MLAAAREHKVMNLARTVINRASFAPVAVVTITAVLGITCCALVGSALDENLKEKGRALSTSLTSVVVDPFVMGEYDRIRKIFEASQQADKDVQYVVMLSNRGDIIASTDPEMKQGATLSKPQLEPYNVTAYSTRAGLGKEVFDVLVPMAVEDQHMILRIGMSQRRKNGLLLNIEMQVVFFVILASLVSWSLVKNLSIANKQLHEAVGVLGNSVDQILSSIDESMTSSRETATAVQETTVTVQQLKETSRLSSETAKRVFDSARRSNEISAAGRRATEETLEGMSTIRSQMDAAVKSMVQLGEKSQDIVDIISTVDDLSRRANLLAVNAAIEAAKAGEHGKGFAVVAQEVRDMAAQSKGATTRVRAILDEIGNAASSAAQATELGARSVDTVVNQSSKATDSIVLLANSVTESSTAAATIATISRQQEEGADQVVHSMSGIKEAADRNVSAMGRLETAGLTLSSLRNQLRELVTRY
jgi:methyl-accepting chemotaxis protein